MELGSSQHTGDRVSAMSEKGSSSARKTAPSKKSSKLSVASKNMFTSIMASTPSVKRKDQPEKVGQHTKKKPKMDELSDEELLLLCCEITRILQPLQD